MHEDNRDIVDQLAERFYRLDPQRGDFRPWSSAGAHLKQRYQAMAQEAVRCVAFAIHAQCEKSHGKHYEDMDDKKAVTPELAPADWVYIRR